jgi:hypothetical protein
MARLPNQDWFREPQGADCPEKLFVSAKQSRPCRATFIGTDFNGYLECRMRLILDSQQPRVILSIANDMGAINHGGHLVYTAQDNDFHMGIEKPGNAAAEEIRQLKSRGKHPEWFEGKGLVSFVRIQPRKPAVQVGAPWMLEGEKLNTWTRLHKHATAATQIYLWSTWETSPGYAVVEKIHSWMRVLQHLVHSNTAKDSGEPQALWAYRSEARNSNNRYSRRPELPWLRSAKDGSYCQWVPADPSFYDEHERRGRLLEASRAEWEGQRRAIVDVFNYQRVHQAWFYRVPGTTNDFFVHVKVMSDTEEGVLVVPELAEQTEVRFRLAPEGNEPTTDMKGVVVDLETTADFVMLAQRVYRSFDESTPQRVLASIEPNLMPIENQIQALEEAGNVLVHGDQPEHHGEGYSLRRTILAHGAELDPKSEHFFELDIYKMSSIPEALKEKRLRYILSKFPLDEAQREAFNKSTSAICVGVHLIQGPPGTGKTRTALVIILALASLNLRVMLAAGSNKGVDNLAIAVAKAIQSDEFLKSWCGRLVRFKTRACQMAVLRAKSALPGRATGEVRGPEAVLEPHQMHHLVKQYAESNCDEDKDCREYLDLLRRDSERATSQR